jgi:DNA-binding transcriptional MerR regulator
VDNPYLLAGEFGAVAQLSPKALRLYADQGLLVPASVDPATGYRYYAPDQVGRARLIGRLRRLGLPLARIGHLADLTPAARELELRGWLRTQRELLDERSALIDTIHHIDPALEGLIAVRDVPAVKVLCRSRRIGSAALPDLVGRADRDIRAHLRASGLPDDGRRLVTFHDLVTPDSEAVVEVAVTCAGNLEPVDDLHIRLVPAHREVYLPVPEAYEDLPLVLRPYDAIGAWTDARPDIVCIGHPYQIHPGTNASFDVAYPITTS